MDQLRPRWSLPFDERQLAAAVDVFVRTALSHVMQPTGRAQETADDITWVVDRVLAGTPGAPRAASPGPVSW